MAKRLTRKQKIEIVEGAAATMAAEMLDAVKRNPPKYPKLKAPRKSRDNCMLEISVPDLHLGKLCWGPEAGQDYDAKLAAARWREAVRTLAEARSGHRIGQILLPVGNDFFNVDSFLKTTTEGTPQDEDGRWQKTFTIGREIVTWAVDYLQQIAPVRVVVVPGNHDAQRVYYLGHVLDANYAGCPRVEIDIAPTWRKYVRWGEVLLGFTHGDKESVKELPNVMAREKRPEWGKARFCEWHIGHHHRGKKLHFVGFEEQHEVIVRFISSLSTNDAWHTSRGYKSVEAAEAFVWHPREGIVHWRPFYPGRAA